MTTATPTNPYLMEEPPTSPGRALLARAFAHWCGLTWGFSEAEIAAAFDGGPGAEPDVVRRVASAARLLGEVMAAGRVRTWARPIGGGLPEPIDQRLWELDDYRPRMASSALALARPFDSDTPPSHWVFVELDDFNALVDEVLGDGLPRRPAPVTAEPAPNAAEPSTRQVKPERHIRLREVLDRTGLSKSTIYARIAQQRFPATLPTDGNIAVWSERELEEWLADPR